MTGVSVAGGRRRTPVATGVGGGLRAPPVALGLLAVGVFAWWAVAEGGAAPTTWYPGALALLAALVAVGRPRHVRRLTPSGRWALAALAAFTAWSFASIAWAQARGDAWDGANRTLLYLVVFALFAAVPWEPSQAAAVLGALVLATLAVAAGVLIAALAASDRAIFVDGRLAGPVGYENASGAIFLAAFWPAVVLAARQATPPPARALMLAAAGVLVELAILTQSRGSLIAGAAALALALWLTAERGRLLVALAAVGATAAASLPLLLAVYRADPAGSHAALVRAAVAVAVSAVLLLAAGLASSRLDGRPVPRPARLPLRWSVLAAVAALAVAGSGAALARPALLPDAGGGASTRFTAGIDDGRYDLWRVAAGQFVEHPLQGAGADNFAQAYARDRRFHDELMYPHSIEWRTLGQTGLVGGALLAGFLAAAFVTARRLARDPARASVAVAAVVAAGYWLAHASVDWLWELPAAGAPAFACLGLVAGLAAGGARGSAAAVRTPAASAAPREWRAAAGPAPPRPRLLPLAGPAAIALAALAALSLALPALAAYEVEHAARIADRDPAAAQRALDRARRLDPLSDRPDVVAGALARGAGDLPRARRAFARAVERDPHSWHSQTELAVLELAAGQRATALARLARARALSPLEPAIGAALDAARRGTPVPAAVTERLSLTAVPGPLGPRPVTCRPVLGLAAACSRGVGR